MPRPPRDRLWSSWRQRVADITAERREHLEQARTRSAPVDVAMRLTLRNRPIAMSMIASALAFRMFLLMLPLAYVLIAGLNFLGDADAAAPERWSRRAGLSAIVAQSVSGAVQASEGGRWLAMGFGIVGTVLAGAGLVTALQRVCALAWGLPPPRGRNVRLVLGTIGSVVLIMVTTTATAAARSVSVGLGLVATILATAVFFGIALAGFVALPHPQVPTAALVPGALLFTVGLEANHLLVVYYFVPKAARASAVYGSLGVALVVLASLAVIGLLIVLAAEFNAVLWERGMGREASNG